MNELDLSTTPGKEAERRANIIAITPAGQDPVIFWHQVAQDAIRTSENDRRRAENARASQRKAEEALRNFTDSLVQRTAEAKSNTPIDLSRLVELAQTGMIDLNINISISGTRKGEIDYGKE